MNELLENLTKVSKRNLDIQYTPAKKGEIEQNYANITKAIKTLNWNPAPLWNWYQQTYDYLSKIIDKFLKNMIVSTKIQ